MGRQAVLFFYYDKEKFLMNLKKIIDEAFTEERNGNDFLKFNVQLGENEGENIPHFHLDNGETGKKQKKTAIMIDKPYYFLQGDKTYILNSKEKKLFILWINSKPSKIIKGNEQNGELPKSNWENLRNMWNNYYPQAKITCPMPNYNLLERDYKKSLD